MFFHLKCECGGWSTHLDTELRPFPVFIRMGTVSHPIISHRVSLPYLGGLHTVHTHHNTTSDSGDLHPLYHYTPMSLQPTASPGASPPPPSTPFIQGPPSPHHTLMSLQHTTCSGPTPPPHTSWVLHHHTTRQGGPPSPHHTPLLHHTIRQGASFTTPHTKGPPSLRGLLHQITH